MGQKVSLKSMRCPTCGATLKAENNTNTITCVYCGNSIVPILETGSTLSNDNQGGFNGVLKVEGIKTSSSALAYMEQFFEEYDWEAFSYAQTLSISEIDKLAQSLKVSSADDKNTWFVCFKAICVPFEKKVVGCGQVFELAIKEYKKDNLDAYSVFDAYKRIAAMLFLAKGSTLDNLAKIVSNAIKYGATDEEVSEMNNVIERIKNVSIAEVYDSIEDIPEVKSFINEKNLEIAKQLADRGIDAGAEYARAKMLISEKKFVDALNVLLMLNGYLDSGDLAKQIDKYFLISDVLEINGKLYYFSNRDEDGLCLYPTEQGKISDKKLIKNIGKIITNYANVLYYLDSSGFLIRYDFATAKFEKLYKKSFNSKNIYISNRVAYLLTNHSYENSKCELIKFDLAEGKLSILSANVTKVYLLRSHYLVYEELIGQQAEQEIREKAETKVLDLDTMVTTALRINTCKIHGFIDGHVVYTQEAPNAYNRNLFIKELGNDSPARLVESNIFEFCQIICDKLFYYVGNSVNKSLININADGTERKEWPLYISKVLLEQGGWIYFIRKSGYNAILCKSRLDGSKFSVIAADIEEFIEIKNGYLYYINDVSDLVKVRMDGSNLQELCEDVEEVLAVKEDKIIFVSSDDAAVVTQDGISTRKAVKSIYAVDFTGGGIIKIAYDIKTAKKYDDNTVYYIDARSKTEVLYKLNVVTNEIKALLELKKQEKASKTNGFAVAMLIMAISFVISLFGFSAGEDGLTMGAIFMFIGLISLCIGAIIKSNQKE